MNVVRILVRFYSVQTLDPKVIILFFIKNFLGSIYVLPIWFIGITVFEKVWTSELGVVGKDVVILLLDGAGVIFIALLVLICYVWSWLVFTKFSYALQQDGIHIYSGVIVQKHIVIAYGDIEDVQLFVNPLAARLLNLYAIQIKIRSLENTQGILRKHKTQLIPGLSQETARALRPEILRFTHVYTGKKTFFDPVTGNYR